MSNDEEKGGHNAHAQSGRGHSSPSYGQFSPTQFDNRPVDNQQRGLRSEQPVVLPPGTATGMSRQVLQHSHPHVTNSTVDASRNNSSPLPTGHHGGASIMAAQGKGPIPVTPTQKIPSTLHGAGFTPGTFGAPNQKGFVGSMQLPRVTGPEPGSKEAVIQELEQQLLATKGEVSNLRKIIHNANEENLELSERIALQEAETKGESYTSMKASLEKMKSEIESLNIKLAREHSDKMNMEAKIKALKGKTNPHAMMSQIPLDSMNPDMSFQMPASQGGATKRPSLHTSKVTASPEKQESLCENQKDSNNVDGATSALPQRNMLPLIRIESASSLRGAGFSATQSRSLEHAQRSLESSPFVQLVEILQKIGPCGRDEQRVSSLDLMKASQLQALEAQGDSTKSEELDRMLFTLCLSSVEKVSLLALQSVLLSAVYRPAPVLSKLMQPVRVLQEISESPGQTLPNGTQAAALSSSQPVPNTSQYATKPLFVAMIEPLIERVVPSSKLEDVSIKIGTVFSLLHSCLAQSETAEAKPAFAYLFGIREGKFLPSSVYTSPCVCMGLADLLGACIRHEQVFSEFQSEGNVLFQQIARYMAHGLHNFFEFQHHSAEQWTAGLAVRLHSWKRVLNAFVQSPKSLHTVLTGQYYKMIPSMAAWTLYCELSRSAVVMNVSPEAEDLISVCTELLLMCKRFSGYQLHEFVDDTGLLPAIQALLIPNGTLHILLAEPCKLQLKLLGKVSGLAHDNIEEDDDDAGPNASSEAMDSDHS